MRTLAYLFILIGVLLGNPFGGLLSHYGGLLGIEGHLLSNSIAVFDIAVKMVLGG